MLSLQMRSASSAGRPAATADLAQLTATVAELQAAFYYQQQQLLQPQGVTPHGMPHGVPQQASNPSPSMLHFPQSPLSGASAAPQTLPLGPQPLPPGRRLGTTSLNGVAALVPNGTATFDASQKASVRQVSGMLCLPPFLNVFPLLPSLLFYS